MACAATSLADLAVILNFTPSGLAHTLYKLDPRNTAFDIPSVAAAFVTFVPLCHN